MERKKIAEESVLPNVIFIMIPLVVGINLILIIC